MSPVASLVKYRKGIATLWTSTNPILALAEPGYDTDTFKMKIGDGVKTWTLLPYTDVNFVQTSKLAAVNGVATLNASSKVLPAQLSTGVANGLATLDATTKLTPAQLPTTAMLASQRGIANGVASLDGAAKVPASQIPADASLVAGKVAHRYLCVGADTTAIPADPINGITVPSWAAHVGWNGNSSGDCGAASGITTTGPGIYVTVTGLYSIYAEMKMVGITTVDATPAAGTRLWFEGGTSGHIFGALVREEASVNNTYSLRGTIRLIAGQEHKVHIIRSGGAAATLYGQPHGIYENFLQITYVGPC